MKKNDILRYCAGGVFLLQVLIILLRALIWIFRYGNWGILISSLITCVPYGLIGVSFFVKKPVMATVVGAARVIVSAIGFLICLVDGEFSGAISTGQYWIVIRTILGFAQAIIFLVLTITRKKQLGYAAAVIYGIGCLGNILFLHSSPTVGMILDVAGYVLTGLAYEHMPAKVRASTPVRAYNSAADIIQRLENLQNLLEKGIITQEEFDAKKHQLLEG